MFKQVIALGLLVAATQAAFVCTWTNGFCINDGSQTFYGPETNDCPRGECYTDESMAAVEAVWTDAMADNSDLAADACAAALGFWNPEGGAASYSCSAQMSARACNAQNCCTPCSGSHCTSGGCTGGASMGRCLVNKGGVCTNAGAAVAGVTTMAECCDGRTYSGATTWNSKLGCQNGSNGNGFNFVGGITNYQTWNARLRGMTVPEARCNSKSFLTYVAGAPPTDVDGTVYEDGCAGLSFGDCKAQVANSKAMGSAMAGDEEEAADSPAAGLAAAAAVAAGAAAVLL